MSDIEDELKGLIVQTLMLKDVQPQQIDPDAPLFAGGLGLDSIDALELAVEIGRRYKVQIKADDERNREIFRSVRTLAAFIAEERTRAEGAR
jgi:acyl carrier protein